MGTGIRPRRATRVPYDERHCVTCATVADVIDQTSPAVQTQEGEPRALATASSGTSSGASDSAIGAAANGAAPDGTAIPCGAQWATLAGHEHLLLGGPPVLSMREMAERAALNAPIQGSAADIVKIAMINVVDALSEAGLKSRLLVQIHDELLLEIAPGEADVAEKLVRERMEGAVALSVPLDVAVGVGASWQLAAH